MLPSLLNFLQEEKTEGRGGRKRRMSSQKVAAVKESGITAEIYFHYQYKDSGIIKI